MPEAALTSIAKSALTLFSSVAKDEALLLWNSPTELQRLQDTFDTIGDLLQDADKTHSEEKAVLSCLSRLRNVMYDAEDLFDSLASEALRKRTMSGGFLTKEVRIFLSRSNQLAVLSKTAHKVKSLKESLDHVKADMIACNFRVRQPSAVRQVLRFDRDKTHSFVHQGDVIGRDEDRERVISMLLHPSEGRSYSVVSIIGFGGLGKTTLAQLVYRDQRVRKEFDLCLWTCINYLSCLEQVLIEIIAAKEGKDHELGLELLQEKMRAMLAGKKFLLVIDDLWDEDRSHWLKLDTFLRCGVSGKVLVTTRSNSIAECLEVAKSSRVDLAVLSEENAWSLFVKKAFYEGEVYEYPELEELGRKIVSRCGYVPLAISVVGGLLRSRKKEVGIWSDFLEKELGRVLLGGDPLNIQKSIMDVLMVSYRDLLPNLKLCFAYCSLFPKDYVFSMDVLVRLWISQGFVYPDDEKRQSLEEIGETYFFYLVDRCFFQHVQQHFAYHTMHDLIHDMAINVAKTDMKFFDKDHIRSGESVSLRHISMHPEIDASFNYCKLVSNPSKVRTILFHRSYQNRNISQGSLDKSLTSFRRLRTLSFSSFKIETISDSIGELIHLRYLELSECTNLRHLPNSICKIHHLLFLNLRDCSKLERLPPKIGKLVSLRQLIIGGCGALESLPEGLAELTALVDLDRLIVHRESGGLGYLENLNELSGFLRVELPEEGWPNAVEDAKRSNMSEKHGLKYLVVSWKRRSVGSSIPTQQMTKEEAEAVLEALKPHGNLEKLEVENYGGQKLPHWFSMIKNLKELSLDNCGHVEYLVDEMKENSGFVSLERLKIEGMRNLKGWWRNEMVEESRRPCLDKLKSLSIKNCPKLKGKMPLLKGIEELNLARVDAQCMSGLMTMNLNKLRTARLFNIKGLVCLPEEWIRHLTSLENLEVCCRDLKWISRHGLAKLTSLKCLQIGECECEIRDEDEDKVEVEEGMPWKALQGLSSLSIPVSDMQLQKALGNYLTLLQNLHIRKWVEREDFAVPSKALRNLHRIHIGFEGDQTCDLRQTGLHNLPLLTSLHIEGCKELYICWALLFNMKLKDLTLKNVGNVIGVEDTVASSSSGLQSQPPALAMKDLTLEGATASKWVHEIPWESLQSLLRLHLEGGKGEEEEQLLIPDQIQHLSSLEHLIFGGNCKHVTSIPKWLPHLKSLRYLAIQGCSKELKRRCEKEKGEDWPLLSHITTIRISPMLGLPSPVLGLQ